MATRTEQEKKEVRKQMSDAMGILLYPNNIACLDKNTARKLLPKAATLFAKLMIKQTVCVEQAHSKIFKDLEKLLNKQFVS